MKRYVIVGGSIAGVSCVEGIRSVDRDGEITLLSAEAQSNYGRPLISYYLEGKTDLANMSWRGADFYAQNRVQALHGVRAAGIDAASHRLTLSDGRELDYDALCVCTGSQPFTPPFEGLETVERRCNFMTLEDARWLEQTVTQRSRVLILGAGFIGLKCAEGLLGRAGSVTVCDLADHAMSASLDAESAGYLERHLEARGIHLRLGDTVARFYGNSAQLRSGAVLPFDVLVLAVGVRPDASLLAGAGAAVGRGILVDAEMRTSLPDIWGAGDCTESRDQVTGELAVLANLPNASLQGRCAGVNMAGGTASLDGGIRMNAVGVCGLHLMSAGTRDEPVYAERTERTCKKLYAKDGVLTGFILVGDVTGAGIYTALIRNRTPLDAIDFETIQRAPSLLPFGRRERTRMLGGAV
ncbi:MAG: FAD-dependent oxidoreductase [Oscillospiraceae bacterium]|nr:FAD-dependent oxidoreductase [Oscillospiraceae bacterium]